METENKDWKPEVGGKAWWVCLSTIKQGIVSELDVFRDKPHARLEPNFGWIRTKMLFQTPEAALASIKVYDLEGKEVLIPHAQDKIIIEMCDRAADSIFYLSEWDDNDFKELGMAPIINALMEIIAVRDKAAIKMVAKLVYEMNLPENPEGDARLKAAQDRFKSLGGGESDQREGGC